MYTFVFLYTFDALNINTGSVKVKYIYDKSTETHTVKELADWQQEKQSSEEQLEDDQNEKKRKVTDTSSETSKKAKPTSSAIATSTVGNKSLKKIVEGEKISIKLTDSHTQVYVCSNAMKPENDCDHIWCCSHGANHINTGRASRQRKQSTRCCHNPGDNCSVSPISAFSDLKYVFSSNEKSMTCKEEGCLVEFH